LATAQVSRILFLSRNSQGILGEDPAQVYYVESKSGFEGSHKNIPEEQMKFQAATNVQDILPHDCRRRGNALCTKDRCIKGPVTFLNLWWF